MQHSPPVKCCMIEISAQAVLEEFKWLRLEFNSVLDKSLHLKAYPTVFYRFLKDKLSGIYD